MAKKSFELAEETAQETIKQDRPTIKVRAMQLAIGVDLIGSKMSMAASKNIDLEATPIGIRMFSKASNRTVIIPYSNVKGFELEPNQ